MKRKKILKMVLIDLVKYEKDLLFEKENRIPLKPVASIPSVNGFTFSPSELSELRANRDAAREVYNRIRYE